MEKNENVPLNNQENINNDPNLQKEKEDFCNKMSELLSKKTGSAHDPEFFKNLLKKTSDDKIKLLNPKLDKILQSLNSKINPTLSDMQADALKKPEFELNNDIMMNSMPHDYSSESEEEECISNAKPFKSPKPQKPIFDINKVDTEGISPELGAYLSNGLKKILKGCNTCNKWFKEDMMVKFKDINAESQCYHCLYWLNYLPNVRKQVDGAYGLSIAEYILKCKDNHNQPTCKRGGDYGGCFLCEAILGIPITDIKDAHKLNPNNELPDKPIEDFDNMGDTEIDDEDDKITIYI